jgi:photosystem II stability/assembly factor-like uncharacterized protein
MKIRILFLVIISLFSLSLQGFSQWNWLNPLPQGNTLHSVFALDSLTCWAAGGCGTVMKTTDGGTTWSIVSTGTTEGFNKICFTDSLNGWASCSTGKIFHSDDGGQSWHLQFDGEGELYIDALTFTNELCGYAAGMTIHYAAIVLMTRDGGWHWIKKIVDANGALSDICFTDDRHGWAVNGRGRIYCTSDAGANWALQLDAGNTKNFYLIRFVDHFRGWAFENYGSNMFLTTDGGLTWIMRQQAACPNDVHFVNSSHGYMCGATWLGDHYQGWIRESVNGGNTWGAFK